MIWENPAAMLGQLPASLEGGSKKLLMLITYTNTDPASCLMIASRHSGSDTVSCFPKFHTGFRSLGDRPLILQYVPFYFTGAGFS